MSVMSEEEILHRLQQGDGNALEALYNRYASLVYTLALQITKETPLAQEVVQDVFTKVWVSPNLYDPARGRFSSWLLTITRNIAIDALRKRARKSRFSIVPPLELQQVFHHTPVFAEGLVRKETASAVRSALDSLLPEHQVILKLSYWEGHSLSEVAGILNLPLGTVKSRLHAALKILRKQMLAWEEDRS